MNKVLYYYLKKKIIISTYFLSINDDRETSLVNKVMKTELTI